MKLRDRYGWPVERIKGRPITNAIRLLLHTSLWQTWRWSLRDCRCSVCRPPQGERDKGGT